MNPDRYEVEGMSFPTGYLSAEGLTELARSGRLGQNRVRHVQTGEFLTPEQLHQVIGGAHVPTVQMPGWDHAKVDGNKDPMRFVAPVHASGWAVAAGYLGLFSLMVVPGPLAVIASVLALKDLKKNPNKTGKGRAIFGLIMGSLGSIGLGIAIAMSMNR